MTSGRKKQLRIAIGMLLIAAISWPPIYIHVLGNYATTPCAHKLLVFALTFFSTIALWNTLLCKWSFPKENLSDNLMHFTPAWQKIKKQKLLFPSADARIYLVDHSVILGQKSSTGHDTKIVFEGAKSKLLAVRADYSPFEYLRFKTARGEFMTPSYHALEIIEFVEKEEANEVVVRDYQLHEIKGAARRILFFRRYAAMIFLSPLLHSLIMASFVVEAMSSTVSAFWELKTFWVVAVVIALLIVGFNIQGKLNHYVFNNVKIG